MPRPPRPLRPPPQSRLVKILGITNFPAAWQQTSQQHDCNPLVVFSCSCHTAGHADCCKQAFCRRRHHCFQTAAPQWLGVSCRLRWCHTDLGANILSWPRLIQEDKRFSQLGPIACGLSAEHFDGVLAHHLLHSNWTVHHVTNSCLYDHSPSPQVCTLLHNLPCRFEHCRRTCLVGLSTVTEPAL